VQRNGRQLVRESQGGEANDEGRAKEKNEGGMG